MPLWNAGKDIKKKRVLVRPNLAWAMSGLNYLETGCLPSHNGSTMKLKEYSWFFYFFVPTLYFSSCFKKMSQNISFMKIRMLLQKRFQPIERVEPNLKYLPHFCKFEICCSFFGLSFIHSDVLKIDFWQNSFSSTSYQKNLMKKSSWFVTFIYLFELLVSFFSTNLNFLPLYEGFNDISDIKRWLMRK